MPEVTMTIKYFSKIMAGIPIYKTSGKHSCNCGGSFVVNNNLEDHIKTKRHIHYIKQQLLLINSN
jgi:hypothetical protein